MGAAFWQTNATKKRKISPPHFWEFPFSIWGYLFWSGGVTLTDCVSQLSMVIDRTLEIDVPIALWAPEQLRQKRTPKLIEAQSGSKQKSPAS